MICHDQLIHAIEQEMGLTHGIDFLVAHPLDKNGVQCGEAYLFRWMNKDVMAPDIERMKARYRESHCETYEANIARERRDALLVQTDWSQAQDVPATVRAKYADYRQALRDITDQPGFPTSIDWPLLAQ